MGHLASFLELQLVKLPLKVWLWLDRWRKSTTCIWRCHYFFSFCVIIYRYFGFLDYGWTAHRHVRRDEGWFTSYMGRAERRWVWEWSGVWQEFEDGQVMCWYHLCMFYFIQLFLISSNRRTGHPGCRYGVGDSVALAVQLEQRYHGVCSPHKFKGGVSCCVRECAEAQSKDFGVIATDKGWNSERLPSFPHSLTLLYHWWSTV